MYRWNYCWCRLAFEHAGYVWLGIMLGSYNQIVSYKKKSHCNFSKLGIPLFDNFMTTPLKVINYNTVEIFREV